MSLFIFAESNVSENSKLTFKNFEFGLCIALRREKFASFIFSLFYEEMDRAYVIETGAFPYFPEKGAARGVEATLNMVGIHSSLSKTGELTTILR